MILDEQVELLETLGAPRGALEIGALGVLVCSCDARAWHLRRRPKRMATDTVGRRHLPTETHEPFSWIPFVAVATAARREGRSFRLEHDLGKLKQYLAF
jgi:hypothetical protein